MISEKEIQELPPISGVGKLNSCGPHEGGADAGNLGRPADEAAEHVDRPRQRRRVDRTPIA
jgi:hypothetical protein